MLSIAFKEWAVVCHLLATGRQSLILRKGGIAESEGEFRPEHQRFLLYPTYYHEQQRAGIKRELLPLLEECDATQPASGTVEFAHFAEVISVTHITNLEQALALDPLHCWTDDTVRKRFHYRTPGLFALAVRVYQLPRVHHIHERPEYAGCKSWVFLTDGVSTAGASPVIDDGRVMDISRSLLSLTTRG